MELKVETITPEIAMEMLKKNTGNFRTCDKNRVELYAKEMKAGRWELNGETIKFNGSKLIDGQTRLNAIIKSGVAIKSAVAYHVEADGISVDKGKPRTVSQWITHEGKHKNATIMAAVARMCLFHETGKWNTQSFANVCVTPTEIIDFCNKHADCLQGAIKISKPCGNIVTASSLAAIVAVGSGMTNPLLNETALWFCDKIARGESLEEGEPVLALRNALARNGNKSVSLYMARMLATIAWNKTVLGERCALLRLTLTGPSKQKAPNKILVAE